MSLRGLKSGPRSRRLSFQCGVHDEQGYRNGGQKMTEPEARRNAALKLSAILDDLIAAGESTRALGVIEALGLTGSELAGQRLGRLYDQTESTDIEDAVIRALGEVGRHACA
jgi:hypothetical protein